MKVYKFGGASVSSAESIRNMAEILRETDERLIVVVSAFGKITNALEKLLAQWLDGDYQKFESLSEISHYHGQIIEGLFSGKHGQVTKEYEDLISLLDEKLRSVPSDNYDFEYDQLVSMGEVLSTTIISHYLKSAGLENRWVDARHWMITDSTYREANVDFAETSTRLRRIMEQTDPRLILTQGFIGATTSGFATTLGREGSDYSAAIAAGISEADSLVVWKDVPGILTADPALFIDAEKIDEMSYHEAIELSFYGAKVIHPKTIKPLQNKGIPLMVKSFADPYASGTMIHDIDKPLIMRPIRIVKHDQMLISLFPKDYSFVVEECLSKIFALFFRYRIKVNLIQHSAISFTICMDNGGPLVNSLIDGLSSEFRVLYNEGLRLMTIRHYTGQEIETLIGGLEVLVEQRSRSTVMFVVR